jgi:HEAT repeat protein
LVEAIKPEKDPSIRLEIIRTLGKYPSSAADGILKLALADSDAHVRMVACEAWGKRNNDPQAVQLLAEAMRSDVDADVRLAAARGLGETKNKESVNALGEALSDSDPAMQNRAMASLKAVTGKDLGNDVNRWQAYVKGDKPAPEPSWAERLFHWY